MKEGKGSGRLGSLVPRTRGVVNDPQYAVWGWRELPVPVIAAVHGVALGGGFQLMLGADMRFIAPDTKLSILEIKWGLVPDMAGTPILAQLVRDDILRDLTFTGRIFSGKEAQDYGPRHGFATIRTRKRWRQRARSLARARARSARQNDCSTTLEPIRVRRCLRSPMNSRR
jgi:enoyl-CoA hydratase/carnithine racemase